MPAFKCGWSLSSWSAGRWSARRRSSSQAYSESNLHDLPLTFGVGRRWPDVASNVASRGWVQTRIVGAGTPDDLDQAHLTRAWLAVGDDQEARRSGGVFYHRRPADMHPVAREPELQDCLLDYRRERSGVAPA